METLALFPQLSEACLEMWISASAFKPMTLDLESDQMAPLKNFAKSWESKEENIMFDFSLCLAPGSITASC